VKRERVEELVHQAVLASYRAGVKEGVQRYAVWKDGEQLVGIMREPLGSVLARIDHEPLPGVSYLLATNAALKRALEALMQECAK
jgi:hypothetical protein